MKMALCCGGSGVHLFWNRYRAVHSIIRIYFFFYRARSFIHRKQSTFINHGGELIPPWNSTSPPSNLEHDCLHGRMSTNIFVEAFMFRGFLAAVVVVLSSSFAAPLMAQGAPPQGGADQPYAVEYYYKVQWGHQQEF